MIDKSFSDFEVKKMAFGKNIQQGIQNCILRVDTIFRGKLKFQKFKYISYHFRIVIKKTFGLTPKKFREGC